MSSISKKFSPNSHTQLAPANFPKKARPRPKTSHSAIPKDQSDVLAQRAAGGGTTPGAGN